MSEPRSEHRPPSRDGYQHRIWARIDSWRADCCADVPPCSYHQGCIDGIEALGIEHVPDLGLHATAHYIEGVPFGVDVKEGEGYHGDFPLDDADEPVFRLTTIFGLPLADYPGRGPDE